MGFSCLRALQTASSLRAVTMGMAQKRPAVTRCAVICSDIIETRLINNVKPMANKI